MRLARTWMLILAMFASTMVLQIQHSPAASACSCIGYDFEEAVAASDLIAHIEVVRVLDNDGGYVSYRVAVDRVWKGEHSNNVIMRTHEQGPACGLGRASVGDSWILWASGGEGNYSATWCHLPMHVSSLEMEDMLTEHLGEPTQLEPYVNDVRDSLPAIGAILGGLLCVGVVVILILNSPRRPTG